MLRRAADENFNIRKPFPTMHSYIALILSFLLITMIPPAWALPPERHPVLLYEFEDLPRIKERITRAPYDAWWAWIQDQADEALTLDFSTIEGDRFKTRYAKALAFAYVVTDSLAYADRAKAALVAVQFPVDGGQWGELHFEAEGAANYIVAYDMLADYLSGDAAVHAQIRNTIYREGHRLFTTAPFWYLLQKNNWAIRQYSALGLIAMALADYEGGASTPEQWAEKARAEVLDALSAQIDEDGGYAEGPYYHRYAAELYLPYMLALRRFTGEDLLARPEIHALHDWSVKIRLPNGLRPNVDDAHLSGFFGDYLTKIYDNGPVHHWDWENASELFAPEYTKIDAVCLFDDQGAAEPAPWNPTLFIPEAGQAVFRSDWSPEATYFLLLGEHGKAAKNGWGHEHPDALSFILYAGGEMLATDGGYIRWDDRTLVNKAQNHNLILVDGEGPSGGRLGVDTEAYIENSFTTTFLDYTEVRTIYRGVTFRRHAFFPDKRYVILVDDIDSNSGSHRYDWLLHGGGLPFEYKGIGGRWTVGDMELLVGLNGSNVLSLDTEVGIHSFDYLQKVEHTTLKVTQTAEDAQYMAVLFPKNIDEGDPVIGPVRREGLWGMAVIQDDTVDIALRRDQQGVLLFSDALKGVHVEPVQSDAAMGWFHFESDSLRAWYIMDGQTLSIGSDSVLCMASQPLYMALSMRGSIWEGTIRGTGETSLSLSTPVEPDSVVFNGRLVDTLYRHGHAVFDVEGKGPVRVYLGERFEGVGVIEEDRNFPPSELELSQNIPNPFNASTDIGFQVPNNTEIRLTVHNVTGQQVRVLLERTMKAGTYHVQWDGKDESGNAVGTGLYLYRMVARSASNTSVVLVRKMVLVQ